jgi:hypothetical protein
VHDVAQLGRLRVGPVDGESVELLLFAQPFMAKAAAGAQIPGA